MNIASAAHAPAPSLIAMGAPRGASAAATGGDAQFARQLHGLTEQDENHKPSSTNPKLWSFADLADSPGGAGFSLRGASAAPDPIEQGQATIATSASPSSEAAIGSDQFASQFHGPTEPNAGPEPSAANPNGDQSQSETAEEANAGASSIPSNAPAFADTDATVDRQFRMPATNWSPQLAFAGAGIGTMPQVPRPLTRAVDPARPQPTAKQSTKTSRAQAATSESAQTAPVDVIVANPVPQIETAVVPPNADSTGDSIDSQDFDAAAKPHSAPEAPEPEEAAPPVVTAADSQAQPREMAFATRVQPLQSTEHSALPAEMASTAAVASASKKVVAATDAETAPPADPHAPLTTATTTVERTAEPTVTSSPAPHAAPATRSAEPPAPAENLPKATAPLKDISLQVNQPGKERVDIRVVQQGSEVHVSVHSGDASLTSGLRQGLSELQSKLEETGYRSEMWRPGTSATPVATASASQESTNHQRGGDGQPQQDGSQQDSGRRNQNHNQSNQNPSNRNQSNQPRWVEELKSSFAEEKSSGGFYGFTS